MGRQKRGAGRGGAEGRQKEASADVGSSWAEMKEGGLDQVEFARKYGERAGEVIGTPLGKAHAKKVQRREFMKAHRGRKRLARQAAKEARQTGRQAKKEARQTGRQAKKEARQTGRQAKREARQTGRQARRNR